MLNRNKKDINSYVNSNDLERYLAHLRFDNPFIWRHSDLGNSVDELFQGDNTVAIILLHDDHPSGVGHYICLRKDSMEPEEYTWFDCLGKEIPEDIQGKFPRDCKVHYLDKALMSSKENLCGKYCIAFINAGNIGIEHFANLLSSSSYTPDQIIANLYRINYGDNVLEQSF